MGRRWFAALSLILLTAGLVEAGHGDQHCYAPMACAKTCDGYKPRCIPQSQFIETACCPAPLPIYCTGPAGCDTCHHQPRTGPCTFKYWLSCGKDR